MALAFPVMGCLEAMIQRATECTTENDPFARKAVLDRAASELIVLTFLCRSFSDAKAKHRQGQQDSGDSSNFAEPAFTILHRAWPVITSMASTWSFHDVCITRKKMRSSVILASLTLLSN
jgi:hypothetical protein